MRIQNNHAHAYTSYSKHTNIRDYTNITISALECKIRGYKSLTVHLPYEIQHPNIVGKLKQGYRFIKYGEKLKNFLKIKLYWENAPLLDTNDWSLKYGNTEWDRIPQDIDLCLDTGHLILGLSKVKTARNRITNILNIYDQQIKHVHLHENNLKTDQHKKPKNVIGKNLHDFIIKGRTYIYERSA